MHSTEYSLYKYIRCRIKYCKALNLWLGNRACTFWDDVHDDEEYHTDERSPSGITMWKFIIHDHKVKLSVCPTQWYLEGTAKTQYRKFETKYSQKRNCAASFPIPTFMFRWAIYILKRSVCLFCCRCGPFLGIYKSLTDTWMWKLGLGLRNSFSRNT